MSTHNICFQGDLKKKILCGFPLLSVAMLLKAATLKKELFPGGKKGDRYFLVIMISLGDVSICF